MRDVMPWDVLRSTVTKLRDEDLLEDQLTISWHGGEPLMAGIDWYREAFELIDAEISGAVDVVHVFQSNGVLLSDAWCRLLIDRQAHIGVSLDGSEEQSRFRVNWADRPAYDKAMGGVARLNNHGIPWSLLAVVTAGTMENPRDFIDFVRASGCTTLCVKVENTLAAHESTLDGEDHQTRMYKSFIGDLWKAFKLGDKPRVREFEHHAELAVAGVQALPVTVVPLRNLTVAVNGDFTIFAPELLYRDDRAFVFGNVTDTTDLLDCLQSELFASTSQSILSGMHKCWETCEFYRRCGSYYISHKFSEAGTFDVAETTACRLELKALFSELDSLTSAG